MPLRSRFSASAGAGAGPGARPPWKVEAYPPPHDDARGEGPRSVRCDPTTLVPPDATPPPQTRARMRRTPRLGTSGLGGNPGAAGFLSRLVGILLQTESNRRTIPSKGRATACRLVWRGYDVRSIWQGCHY